MSNHIRSITLHHDQYPTADHYPFTLPIFRQTRHLAFDTATSLFVGENGTGKSTLLEALARASGVHIWRRPAGERIQVNHYEEELHKYLGLDWSNGRVPGGFFGSDSFADFADLIDEWAAADPGQLTHFGGESLVTQSHGQSTMSYFRARYRIPGIYFLDEPETALSPRSQLELLDIIEENSRAGHAQFFIATHSPILLACTGATIYSFDHMPVSIIDYEETDHYQVYKQFLMAR